jgi:hypothetical protein
VVRAVKLNVIVEWETYRAIWNNYRIIDDYLQSGPNTDKKSIKIQRRIQLYT